MTLAQCTYLPFMKGGITYSQFVYMLEIGQKREYDKYKFNALLHGADIGGKEENTEKPNVAKTDVKTGMLFGSPEDYEQLSPEERVELTSKMLGKFKTWANDGAIGGKKPEVK